VDTSALAVARRAKQRDLSLKAHGLTEGDMFDRKRPTAYTAERARRLPPEPEFPLNVTDAILNACQSLTQREQQVIGFRYGLVDGQERTQEDIAVLLGISQQRVATIEAWACRKLRRHADAEVA
jgi:DNA-directed RNA polymerase sigma subunit (sigma70/sigma32)